MPNPQQPELRRSGFVPTLDPDATESHLSGEERPSDKGHVGGVPEEQQPGHHPEREQDKPDLDAFAARLGIVPEGEEPADAPRVEDPDHVPSAGHDDSDDDSDDDFDDAFDDAFDDGDDEGSVTRLEDAPSRVQAKASAPTADPAPKPKRQLSPIGLALVGPLTGVKIAKGILGAVTRRKG